MGELCEKVVVYKYSVKVGQFFVKNDGFFTKIVISRVCDFTQTDTRITRLGAGECGCLEVLGGGFGRVVVVREGGNGELIACELHPGR